MGEFQRKYRRSVSHEKKVQRGLGCCSSVAVKSLKLVVSACSAWSLQNGITQEFLNDSILLHNTLLGSSGPDPARACVISNVWQRSTHLRAFLLASGCTNRCWSCVRRLCATDLRRKYIHVLAVVKAENGGNKLASHFW